MRLWAAESARRVAMAGAVAVAFAMAALMALILASARPPRWGPDPGLQQTACPKHWSRAGATCWKMP